MFPGAGHSSYSNCNHLRDNNGVDHEKSVFVWFLMGSCFSNSFVFGLQWKVNLRFVMKGGYYL